MLHTGEWEQSGHLGLEHVGYQLHYWHQEKYWVQEYFRGIVRHVAAVWYIMVLLQNVEEVTKIWYVLDTPVLYGISPQIYYGMHITYNRHKSVVYHHSMVAWLVIGVRCKWWVVGLLVMGGTCAHDDIDTESLLCGCMNIYWFVIWFSRTSGVCPYFHYIINQNNQSCCPMIMKRTTKKIRDTQ